MTYDMVVVGGGMVGATLAIALQQHFKVLLMDASEHHKEDHRLIALSHPSICLLKTLGLWSALESIATPIHEVHVSKRGSLGVTRISRDLMDLDALGYVVPAKYINAVLEDKITVEVIRPGVLKKFSQSVEKVYCSVETKEGLREFTADYMIGADGSHSFVREYLNIPTEKFDYQQSAIVTKTQLQRSHQNIAYERFLKDGAIAMLPLNDNEVATIWTASQASVEDLLKLDDENFLQKLQKTFGYRLGRLKHIGKRYSYPLHYIQARENQKGRVILMGNALHTMQPIAAQGLNIALYEISLLMDYFSQSTQSKASLELSSPRHHMRHAVTNQQDFSQTIGNVDFSKNKIPANLSHHLSTIFSTDFFPWKVARQTSMVALDLFPSLKKYFLQRVLYE